MVPGRASSPGERDESPRYDMKRGGRGGRCMMRMRGEGRAEGMGRTYDLLLRHAREATGLGAAGVGTTAVRSLAALAGNLPDLFLGAIGEVAWVGVVCHDG